MSLEVALLEWGQNPSDDSLRIVGRSRDLELVAAVREHLVQQLARREDRAERKEGVSTKEGDRSDRSSEDLG